MTETRKTRKSDQQDELSIEALEDRFAPKVKRGFQLAEPDSPSALDR